MAANYKTLSAFEVATAEEAQSYFMDQAIIKVDTATDLTGLPNTVKTAYVQDTGILMARNVANAWVRAGGAATVNETAPSDPQVGDLWVKPSELLPIPVRGEMVGTAVSFAGTVGSWVAVSGQTTKSITLPKAAMCIITWGAWLSNSSGGGDFQARMAWSGASTGNTYDQYGGYAGTAMLGTGEGVYHSAGFPTTVVLAAGTTTFSVECRRSATGATTNVYKAGVGITPVQWADAYADGVS